MTQLLLVISLVVVLAVVLILVGYLVGIIYFLWGGKNALEKLAGGLLTIRDNTNPLSEYMHAINGGLSTLLNGLLDVNANLAAIVKVAQGKA